MSIWKSRAFWTAVVDAVIGIVFLVIGAFWPQYQELATQVWVLLQPIILAIIAAFTVDDTIKKFRALK